MNLEKWWDFSKQYFVWFLAPIALVFALDFVCFVAGLVQILAFGFVILLFSGLLFGFYMRVSVTDAKDLDKIRIFNVVPSVLWGFRFVEWALGSQDLDNSSDHKADPESSESEQD